MSTRHVALWVVFGGVAVAALVGAGAAWLAWAPVDLPAPTSPPETTSHIVPPLDSEPWLDAFRSLPGARRLCDGHVLGSVRAQQQVEIGFTLYASRREPSEVTRFYADAHQLPWKPHQETISVRPNDGAKVLSVRPVSSSYPECGVKPGDADRTIVVVSWMHPMAP
jgi:hypothetical protein